MGKDSADDVTVPRIARERLGKPESGRSRLYVTDLSPGDMLALRRSGAEPIGQVMGCSVYKISAPGSSAVSGELKMLTGALIGAQRLALGRLREEAALLGADGVLGVRLQRRRIGPHDAPFQEWKVTGTAVRVTPDSRSPAHAPWLSGLSGVEYALLREGGYRPVGLVFGNCAYYRVTDPRRLPTLRPDAIDTISTIASIADPSLSSNTYGMYNWVSFERTEHSEAIAQARSLALQRMEDEGRGFGADGIVGVTTEIDRHTGQITYNMPDMFIHFFAMGTAIAALSGRRADALSANMVMPL